MALSGGLLSWDSKSPAYLPFCPMLRRLRTGYLFPRPRPYIQLEYLTLNVDSTVPIDVLWKMLQRVSPLLKGLQLVFLSERPDEPGQDSPEGPISFSNLRTFALPVESPEPE
ncbi:hypothetical protein AURDEDRAFT_160204 [Auricularia subglabra TFB-10046 SS5]|nr:hypothetical protein AURDEDRAFT_160204 [Auricularia subglabra TFB-10046 SS5]